MAFFLWRRVNTVSAKSQGKAGKVVQLQVWERHKLFFIVDGTKTLNIPVIKTVSTQVLWDKSSKIHPKSTLGRRVDYHDTLVDQPLENHGGWS